MYVHTIARFDNPKRALIPDPNGQLDIMRDKNVMSKRMQLQSARQESPNVPTAQPDLMEKTDVRPSNASRLRQCKLIKSSICFNVLLTLSM